MKIPDGLFNRLREAAGIREAALNNVPLPDDAKAWIDSVIVAL